MEIKQNQFIYQTILQFIVDNLEVRVICSLIGTHSFRSHSLWNLQSLEEKLPVSKQTANRQIITRRTVRYTINTKLFVCCLLHFTVKQYTSIQLKLPLRMLSVNFVSRHISILEDNIL